MSKQKEGYVLILWDRKTNAQITGQFKDLNSIDQVVPALVKQLKVYNEQNTSKIITSPQSVDEFLSKIKWVDSGDNK